MGNEGIPPSRRSGGESEIGATPAPESKPGQDSGRADSTQSSLTEPETGIAPEQQESQLAPRRSNNVGTGRATFWIAVVSLVAGLIVGASMSLAGLTQDDKQGIREDLTNQARESNEQTVTATTTSTNTSTTTSATTTSP